MQATFYTNFSKRLNSTKRPETGTGTDITMTLKEPTSIIKPVFILTGYNLSYNYVKWGNRYYFVDDIVIVHNNIAEYHCHVDVLASFKASIGNSTQYILRSSRAYNGFINDSIYPTRADCTVNSTLFDQLECFESTHITLNTGHSYVIAIQNGKGGADGGISYYAMSDTSMNNLLKYMFDTVDYLDANDISQELQKELLNPFQYITSVMWFPFNIVDGVPDGIADPENIQFGYWYALDDLGSHIYGHRLQTTHLKFSKSAAIPAHPQAATRGNYLNSSPYTRRTLLFNSFGSIPIDSCYYTSLHPDSYDMTLMLDVDLITGSGTLRVVDYAGNTTYKGYSPVGVSSQISQIKRDAVGAGVSVLGAVWSAAHTNVLGFSQGVVSGLENLMPQRQTIGSIGSTADWKNQLKPILVSTFYSQSAMDADHLGRPLCDSRQISTLGATTGVSGYIQASHVDIDITGTEEEKQAIISYMEGGFYYE